MFGPKMKVIYNNKGQVIGTQEIKTVQVTPKTFKDVKFTPTVKVGPVQPQPKPKDPKPAGTPRSITIAMQMIAQGIRDWSAIEAEIFRVYKSETNRGDNYIRNSCNTARQHLIKQGLL